MALDLHLEATLDNRIARQLTKRALRELQDVCRDAIFLQQGLLQSSLFNLFCSQLYGGKSRTFVKWN